MPPDQQSAEWQKRLLRVVDLALEASPDRRAQLLDEACQDDPQLRNEAAVLLSLEHQAKDFLETRDVTATLTPPFDDPAPLLPDEELLGTRLGKYRLVEMLGRGGMGIVWKAEDTVLHREVAIKLLPEQFAADDLASQRFLKEARAGARLNHPHAVTVYEFGRQDDRIFMAMEYVRGRSVQHALSDTGAIPWPTATQIMIQVCEALAAAHEERLIHRDIKPANILLLENRGTGSSIQAAKVFAKLADFGITKSLREATVSLTGGLATVGTPAYMSPEQIRSEPVDERSDIYSLGATFYALLTGAPFPGTDPLQVMFAHCQQPIPDPCQTNNSLPGGCRQIIAQAMAKRPADRYQQVDEMQAELQLMLVLSAVPLGSDTPAQDSVALPVSDANLPQPPDKSRRLTPTAIALAALLLLASAAAWLASRGADNQQPQAAQQATALAATSTGTAQLEIPDDFAIVLPGEIGSIAMSADASRIAWGHSERQDQFGRIIVRNLGREGDLMNDRFDDSFSNVTCLAFLKDDVLCGATRSQVVCWVMDPNSPVPAHISDLLTINDGTYYTLDVHPDPPLLAAISKTWQDGQTRLELARLTIEDGIYSARSKKQIPIDTSANLVSVRFSADAKWLVASEAQGRIHLIDPATASVVRTLQVESDALDPDEAGHGLAFSPDGKTLAAGGGRAVHLWNLADGARHPFPEGHTQTIMSVAFSDDGTWLASGGCDGIRLWDVATARQIAPTMQGHGGSFVTFLRFLGGKQLLVSAGFDDVIRVQELPLIE